MDKGLNTDTGSGNIGVVIPTYNEAKNIGIMIGRLREVHLPLSVIIVDDNSPDGTSEIVKKSQGTYKNLHLIERDKKMGLGSAYIDGFKYSLKKGYDVIVQMDADLSHSPFYISEMVDLLGEYDLVIGSRYIKKGGVSDWPFTRILLSRTANSFARRLLRLPISDLTSGFKVMRRDVLESMDFAGISSRGYSFQMEMVFSAFLGGFKIAEYPIIFQGRRNERSKMSLGVTGEAFFKVVSLHFVRSKAPAALSWQGSITQTEGQRISPRA